MTRMQFMRGSNGLSFTSDLCLLPKDLNVGKCGDRHKLAAEVSVKLHAALVAQCGRDDFTVSVRFGLQRTVNGAAARKESASCGESRARQPPSQ